MRRKRREYMFRGPGASEDEIKVFKGTAGKVLLQYVQSLTQTDLKKMRRGIKNRMERPEPDERIAVTETAHKRSSGPIRTRTGYVYR